MHEPHTYHDLRFLYHPPEGSLREQQKHRKNYERLIFTQKRPLPKKLFNLSNQTKFYFSLTLSSSGANQGRVDLLQNIKKNIFFAHQYIVYIDLQSSSMNFCNLYEEQ